MPGRSAYKGAVTLDLELRYPDTYPDVLPDMSLEMLDEESGELTEEEIETVLDQLRTTVSAIPPFQEPFRKNLSGKRLRQLILAIRGRNH